MKFPIKLIFLNLKKNQFQKGFSKLCSKKKKKKNKHLKKTKKPSFK